MATYYYNAAVDTDWNNDSNWWLDDAFTIPASGLPSNTDNAISVASIISNGPPESPGDTPTVANFTLNDLTEGLDPPYLGITINVTNTATFNGSASINAQGSIDGNAIFNNGAYNQGTVTGNATFNNAINYATVSGDATFNDQFSFNAGVATVGGNATFNDNTSNGASVLGNATFNDAAFNQGTVTGNATFTAAVFGGEGNAPFNPVGTVSGTITFSNETPVSFTLGGTDIWNVDSSTWIFTTAGQSWTFNDTSYNSSIVNGDATFNSGTVPDTSYNAGTISNNATFNSISYNDTGATISGNATFNDDSYNSGTITGNATFTKTLFTASPQNGTVSGNVIFFPISSGSVSFTLNSSYEWTTNTQSWIFNTPPIFTFNDSSYNNGIITYPVTFNDSSYNDEQVGLPIASLLLHFDGNNGSTTFIDSSANSATITAHNNAQISTFTNKFGGSSAYFDGTSYISLDTSANFDFSTDNFTIEGWLNLNPGSYYGIVGSRSAGATEGWCLYVHPDGTIYTGSVRGVGGYSDVQLNPTPITPNTWTHFALVKTTAGYRLYLNGVSGPLLAEGGFQYLPSSPIAIGDLASNGEYPFTGYIDEFRIIKTAVYTSNFTPPTTPLNATYGNGMDPSAFNDTIFNDSSYNRGIVNGNATFDSTVLNLYPNIPAYNDYTGIVTGNATFNGTTFNNSGTPFGGGRIYGTINGNATFNDESTNTGRINGNATFNSTVIQNYMNNDIPARNSIYGQIGGNATFNGTSYNDGYTNTGGFGSPSSYGTVEGDATFNDEAFNAGIVEGNATFNSAVIFDYMNNDYPARNSTKATIYGNATFNGTSYNDGFAGVPPFSPSSFGTVQGDATFNNTAYNIGIVEGLTTYSVSAAINMIVEEYTTGSHDGGVDIKYEKGINGSSILGLL